MTKLSAEARAWGERLISKMDPPTMPEKYRERAAWDLELFKAALVADELLAACQAVLDEFPARDSKRIESVKRVCRDAIAAANEARV